MAVFDRLRERMRGQRPVGAAQGMMRPEEQQQMPMGAQIPDIGRSAEVLRGTGHQFTSGISRSKRQRFHIKSPGKDDHLKGGLLKRNTLPDQPEQVFHGAGMQTDRKDAHMGGIKGQLQALKPVGHILQTDFTVTVPRGVG